MWQPWREPKSVGDDLVWTGQSKVLPVLRCSVTQHTRTPMIHFRLNLESLDARIVPDATPTDAMPPMVTVQVSIPATPPTIPPMPIPVPQVPPARPAPPPLTPEEQAALQELAITALRIEYLNALIEIERDIAAIDAQQIVVKASLDVLNQAKKDLDEAAVGDKPAMQEIVDLWQGLLETAQQQTRNLIKQYRTDRLVASALYEQLLELGQGSSIPSLQSDDYVLDPTINGLVPLHLVPVAPTRVY